MPLSRDCEVCGIDLPMSMADERISLFGGVQAYLCTRCHSYIHHWIAGHPTFIKARRLLCEMECCRGGLHRKILEGQEERYKSLYDAVHEVELSFWEPLRDKIPGIKREKDPMTAHKEAAWDALLHPANDTTAIAPEKVE